jgi:hypothetical protein
VLDVLQQEERNRGENICDGGLNFLLHACGGGDDVVVGVDLEMGGALGDDLGEPDARLAVNEPDRSNPDYVSACQR